MNYSSEFTERFLSDEMLASQGAIPEPVKVPDVDEQIIRYNIDQFVDNEDVRECAHNLFSQLIRYGYLKYKDGKCLTLADNDRKSDWDECVEAPSFKVISTWIDKYNVEQTRDVFDSDAIAARICMLAQQQTTEYQTHYAITSLTC